MRRCFRVALVVLVIEMVFAALAPLALAGSHPTMRNDRSSACDQRAKAFVQEMNTLPEDNRNEAFAQLSFMEQQRIIECFSNARIEVVTHTEPIITPNAAGCWTRDQSVISYNPVGWVNWEYRVYISWCGDGQWITSWSTWRTVDIGGWWWEFKGDVENWHYGGVGYNGVHTFRQGYFEYCPYEIGYIQSIFPWVEHYAYGNGEHYSYWGEGV